MNLVIIKYNAGNIQSVLYALERIGAAAVVTDDPARISAADKVIFPGVGEASTAMDYLRDRGLDRLIRGLRQPVLGICLGMQLMCSYSEENDTDCMGIFGEVVRKFNPGAGVGAEAGGMSGAEVSGLRATGQGELKVPQIGWNNIYGLRTALFDGVDENSYCYFVHGYYAALGEHTIAKTNYVQPYSSGLHRDNFYGVQFHPEKSALAGERILQNFIGVIN
jgi:glutamine amidotransferase